MFDCVMFDCAMFDCAMFDHCDMFDQKAQSCVQTNDWEKRFRKLVVNIYPRDAEGILP